MARIIAPGIVTDEKRPEKVVAERAEALATAADGILVSKSKRILFGDLHVHTTLLLRRLHTEPAAPGWRRNTSPGRCMRLRAFLFGAGLLADQ